MNQHFQFTRYVYEESEVEIALIIAILNKTDDALFWAYELYYSGFQHETLDKLLNFYNEIYQKLVDNGWNKVSIGEYEKRSEKSNGENSRSKEEEFIWKNYQ